MRREYLTISMIIRICDMKVSYLTAVFPYAIVLRESGVTVF